jgi:hypothetical protein
MPQHGTYVQASKRMLVKASPLQEHHEEAAMVQLSKYSPQLATAVAAAELQERMKALLKQRPHTGMLSSKCRDQNMGRIMCHPKLNYPTPAVLPSFPK